MLDSNISSANSVDSRSFLCLTQLLIAMNSIGRTPQEMCVNCSNITEAALVNNDLDLNSESSYGVEVLITLTMQFCVRIQWYLTELLFKNHSKLRSIHMRENSITGMSPNIFRNLKNLHTVDMRKNLIKDLLPGTFKSIRRVDLSENEITEIIPEVFSFVGVPKSSLKLSNNKISKIHKNAFANCTSLEKLYLNHNEIRSLLNEGIFNGLTSVIEVDLSYNWITRFVTDNFEGMLKLEKLIIEGNPIKTIGRDVPQFISVRPFLNVDLNALRFKCKCETLSRVLDEARRCNVSLPLTCESGVPWDVSLASCFNSPESSTGDTKREETEHYSTDSYNDYLINKSEPSINVSSSTPYPFTPPYAPQNSSYESTYVPPITPTHFPDITNFPDHFPTSVWSDNEVILPQNGISNAAVLTLCCGSVLIVILFILMFIYCNCRKSKKSILPKERKEDYAKLESDVV